MDIKDMGMEAFKEFQSLYSGGKEFIVEQAPIVIKEFLTFSFAESCINIIIPLVMCLFIGIALIVLIRGVLFDKGSLRYREELDTDRDDREDRWYLQRLIPCIVIVLLSVLVLPPSLSTVKQEATVMAKIKFAPRVFMIEKGADLYKEMKK
jgi:hypothetical protein